MIFLNSLAPSMSPRRFRDDESGDDGQQSDKDDHGKYRLGQHRLDS
jgi:hypothetical protein